VVTTGPVPFRPWRSRAPRPPRSHAPRAGVLPLAAIIASMTSVQVGAALSVPLFGTFGVAGTTWLRLALAAAILLVVARPTRIARRDLPAAALLGVVTAVNSVTFALATDRIPLGVTVAVEFCGPLGVAIARAHGSGLRRLAWPALAFAGVLLLTQPWTIGANAARTWSGLGLAATAGVGWAAYIVLTAHVGQRSEGLTGLAVALTAATLALLPLGGPPVWTALRAGHGSGTVLRALAICGLAALLVPLASYSLEMVALRSLDQGVFGVWMALEPAIGTLVGMAVLAQRPSGWQLAGVVLVVGAGVGVQRAAMGRASGTTAGQPGGGVPEPVLPPDWAASTAPP